MTRMTRYQCHFRPPNVPQSAHWSQSTSGDLHVLGQAARENLDSRQSPERFRRSCSGGNIVGRTAVTSQEPGNQVTTDPCASAGTGAETQREPPLSPQELSNAARALVALLYRPARRTGLILPEMALNCDKAYPAFFCVVGPPVYSGKS